MPHSQHGKDTSSSKRAHRRSGSHISKGRQGKAKQVTDDVNKSQPVAASAAASANVQGQSVGKQPGPWSPWIPGDDGRWFYQGRLKADGSGWEYQFTEGYPPASRRWEGNPYAAITPATGQHIVDQPPIAVQTVPDTAPQTRLGHSAMGEEDATQNSDDDDEDQTETDIPTQQLPQVLNIPPFQPVRPARPDQPFSQPQALMRPSNPIRSPTAVATTTKKPGSAARQALVKHTSGKGGSKKQLSAIVKADKDRRLNSRKRIWGWLGDVTP